MATAPRNPYLFFIFFSVLVAAFMILDAFVDVSFLDDKPNYHTEDAQRMRDELQEEESKKAQSQELVVEEKVEDKVEAASADTIVMKTEVASKEVSKGPAPEVSSMSGFEKELRAYKAQVLAQLEPGEKRMDVLVRYYPHEPDGKAVYNLRALGYYLHERPTLPEYADKPSNSLYYGDNVPLKDIQLVAITLLDAGIPLKQITESRFHADWKSNALEIGADTLVNNRPVLSKQDIQLFTK